MHATEHSTLQCIQYPFYYYQFLYLFYRLLYFYLEKHIALNCPHGSLQMMPRVSLFFSSTNVRKVLELSLDENKL